MKKAFCFDYFSMSRPESKFFHVWFEFFPSYLSRKKEISETFLGLGLRPRPQKTFPRFPFFYFGNLGKTQIRRGKILLQTWHGKKSKQNTIFEKFCQKNCQILAVEFFSFNPNKCDVWNPCQVQGGWLPPPHQKSIVTCPNWSNLISNEGLHQIETRRIKEKVSKNEHDFHHEIFWPFQRKNSQSRWFGAKMSSLSQRYVICTIQIVFLVRKLKYSHKYNSSPIFFDTHFILLEHKFVSHVLV